MNISYRRSGTRNYLVIARGEPDGAGFREKMIIRNRIAHLASMTVQSIDEKSYFYYDISGMVSLEALYAGRGMKTKDVGKLLSDVAELLSETQRYMLSCDEILFSPGHVWVHPESMETVFIYVPGGMKSSGWDIKALASFLTEHVDGSDKEAADAAYKYMEMVENGDIMPKYGEGHRVEEREAGAGTLFVKEGTFGDDPGGVFATSGLADGLWDIREGMSDDMKKLLGGKPEDEEKKKRTVYLCLGAGALAAFIYILLVLFPGLFPFELNDSEYTILGVGITIGFGILLAAVMRMYNKKDSGIYDPEKMPAEVPEVSRKSKGGDDEIEYFEQERSGGGYDDRTVLLTRTPSFRMQQTAPVLKRSEGPDIVLGHFPFILGKMGGRVDEVIDDPGVSRIHAMIKEQEGRYYLSDLNSLNGTCINGKKLEVNSTAEISDGDRISLADTSFTFRRGTANQAYAAF